MPPLLRILCLNTGSSSLKFALYELGEANGKPEEVPPTPVANVHISQP